MSTPNPETTHGPGGTRPGPCPICGSSRRPGQRLPPDRLDPRAPAVQLVSCSGCGTGESVVASAGAAGGAGSGGAYLPHTRPVGIRGWLARRGQERKVEVVLPWVMAPGLVDVGCGSGGFLEAWRRRRPGDQLVGMEPDPAAAGQARQRDLVVITQGLEGPLPPGAQGMGIYTLWHVLEHLPDPAGALSLIRRGMAADGRIVLVVPNRSAVERAIYGRWTISWDPPRHRWHFTPEGLSALVRAGGLRVLDRFNLISDDVYDAVGSLRWFLDPRAWTEPRRPRALAATAAALVAGVPAGLLTTTMAPWRSRASLGLVLARA
jgi:SAM-dependent methyltransferase